MKDQDFERAMDAWVDHETEAAPEMRPTADMYRMVQAHQGRKHLFLLYSRWAAVGAAVVSLAVLAILYATVFLDLPSGREMASVGQRAGLASDKGVVVRGTAPPPKGPRGKGIPFAQLMFHFQWHSSRLVEGIDLQIPQEGTISLTPADNYRLLLEPAEDHYVYVFQLTSSDVLVKLFPNETYSSVQNPLRQGQMVYLPSEPNWFYLGEATGTERLYVIASAQPLRDLENLYVQYSQADGESDRSAALSSLLERITAIAETSTENVAGWMLVFDHR
jgi:hypothetical protein